MILDTDRIGCDEEYSANLRHRFLTDHFFAARLIGFEDFSERAHAPAVALYGPKNIRVPISQQPRRRKILHLDPRHTFKTSLKLVDRVQWICAFPEEITILNNSETQPLAEAVSLATADAFYQGPGEALTPLQLIFPELLTRKDPRKSPSDQKWIWNTNVRRRSGAGSLEGTLAYTSPKSGQTGWHPLIMDYDDVEGPNNSGIGVDPAVRQHVIDVCDQNENLLRNGGYISIGGTRYHPFDWYGKKVESSERDPEDWGVLIRASIRMKDGSRLMPGEFPREDEIELLWPWPEFGKLTWKSLRTKFYENYESFMCFTAGHRVLMADWTEKRIENVKVGDEVVGLQKFGRYDSRLVTTKVVRTFARRAEAVESTTTCGRKVRHTADHRFLRPSNGGAMRYVKLRVGCKTVSVYKPMAPPTAEQQRNLDWLGGILDGEGSIQKGAVLVHQKEVSNPEIVAGLVKVLERLGIDYTRGKTHETDRFSLLGGRSLMIWLLNHARMLKVNRIRDGLWSAKQHSETTGRAGGAQSQPKIISIEPIGEQMVYDFETETHNFVCEGFAVHNCQQQNDPQGGFTTPFPEKLYASCLVAPERIPFVGHNGEVFTCWRMAYGGKKNMAKYAEGACAKILDGKVYIVDCWQTTRTPSGLAEMMVQMQKQHQADGMMILDTPGSGYMRGLIQNEAARKNMSIRIQWPYWEEDDSRREAEVKQLEPLMKVGRLMFSTAMRNHAECHKQFVHFGLVEENGIAECVTRLANRIDRVMARADMQEWEIEQQRRLRDDAQLNAFMLQQGMAAVDEQAKWKTEAHLAAIAKAVNYRGMPPLPGGLDG